MSNQSLPISTALLPLNQSMLQRYFLYAEDDPDDQQLLTEIMTELHPDIGLIVCSNGLELMQYLDALKPGNYLPSCIILDMNMPIWDGLRTLKEIKKNALYNELIIVVFTTDSSGRDADRTKAMGATAFINKPIKHSQFEEITQRIRILSGKVDLNKLYIS